MSEFTSHVPGTFSWAELATTDQKNGVAVLSHAVWMGLNEAADGTRRGLLACSRCAARKSRRPTRCALRSVSTARRRIGTCTSPSRMSRKAVKKAESLGAKVLAPPFDVMDAGRMAILQDPTGAVFEVWEAKNSIGAKILNEPGALCWSELTTRDTETRRGVLHVALWMDGEARRARSRRWNTPSSTIRGKPASE